MNYKISYLLVIFLVGAFVSDAYAENIGAPPRTHKHKYNRNKIS